MYPRYIPKEDPVLNSFLAEREEPLLPLIDKFLRGEDPQGFLLFNRFPLLSPRFEKKDLEIYNSVANDLIAREKKEELNPWELILLGRWYLINDSEKALSYFEIAKAQGNKMGSQLAEAMIGLVYNDREDLVAAELHAMNAYQSGTIIGSLLLSKIELYKDNKTESLYYKKQFLQKVSPTKIDDIKYAYNVYVKDCMEMGNFDAFYSFLLSKKNVCLKPEFFVYIAQHMSSLIETVTLIKIYYEKTGYLFKDDLEQLYDHAYFQPNLPIRCCGDDSEGALFNKYYTLFQCGVLLNDSEKLNYVANDFPELFVEFMRDENWEEIKLLLNKENVAAIEKYHNKYLESLSEQINLISEIAKFPAPVATLVLSHMVPQSSIEHSRKFIEDKTKPPQGEIKKEKKLGVLDKVKFSISNIWSSPAQENDQTNIEDRKDQKHGNADSKKEPPKNNP